MLVHLCNRFRRQPTKSIAIALPLAVLLRVLRIGGSVVAPVIRVGIAPLFLGSFLVVSVVGIFGHLALLRSPPPGLLAFFSRTKLLPPSNARTRSERPAAGETTSLVFHGPSLNEDSVQEEREKSVQRSGGSLVGFDPKKLLKNQKCKAGVSSVVKMDEQEGGVILRADSKVGYYG